MSRTNESSILSVELQKMPAWVKNLTLVVGASLLLGLFAHISIHLPFTPIAISIQPSLVLLFGILLGSKRAVSSVAAFLTQGALGLPFFAGGASGLSVLMGPKGGYYFGYLVAAFAVGKLMEVGGKRTILNAFLSMLAGNIIIYLFGSFVLSFYFGGVQALLLGVVPFILGDLVKMALGLKLLQCIGWEEKRDE